MDRICQLEREAGSKRSTEKQSDDSCINDLAV